MASFVSVNTYTYSAGSANAFEVIKGPDGNVWQIATQVSGASIVKVTPAGVLTQYSLGTRVPRGLCTDGTSLWLLDWSNGNPTGFSRVTTSGVITDFGLSFPDSAQTFQPEQMCYGPDGNLWAAQDGGPTIHSVFKLPLTGGSTGYVQNGMNPFGICSDGTNLWISDQTASVGVWKVTTAGVITQFPFTATGSVLAGICLGPDGNLWAVDNGTTKGVWKITTAGVHTKYAFASTTLRDIAIGPDNNLWAADSGANVMWQITTAGVATSYTGGPPAGPWGVCTGGDSKLWTNNLGNITFYKCALPSQVAQLVMPL